MIFLDLKDLEIHLWEAAHIITFPIDASDYKTFIFLIFFFKSIYDEKFINTTKEILTLNKFSLGKNKEIFDKVYGYIREHY
ncbi:hypothetical protein V3519_12485 [Acinetobacter variabilis]|uniref:hypothetical protein n=1 Tax=Acinetobacter variabilis TaxID=70346 RepID=UPI0030F8FF24